MSKRWGWAVAWMVVVLPVSVSAKSARHASPSVSRATVSSEPFSSAILVEAESGSVLFEKNPHRQAPPASMTKMMLMLLVAEGVRDGRLHWDDPVRVSERASKIGGSQVYLKSGEVFPLAEMMQAVVIHSANDAAYAVAEMVAGSAAEFVARMNERAVQLGMHDTKYQSVHGLPPEAGKLPDLSSASDLAVLARQLVGFPDILRWSSTKEATFRNGSMVLTNTNRLVRETDWIDGLKTGSYHEAGFNVTATGHRDGMRLIAVVMGVPRKEDCFSAAEDLLSNGFAEYHAVAPVHEGDVVANDVAVKGGRPRFVRVVAGRSLTILSKRGKNPRFTLQLTIPREVEAPLAARQVVGEVVVHEGDNIVGTVPAVAADNVEVGSLWDRVF
ncbi:MAG TPA: D-alanyl-D-alanine carboxypeptidase family protein [Candidatus Acidoferrales bacterium]|nr:D-alanyl-D-alanine carboxypeptidase family protein [Candidatus Acidoferrales bacterium]